MKKSLILTLVMAIGSFSALAQGSIYFQASHSIYSAATGTLAGSTGDYGALLFFSSSTAANNALNSIFSGAATSGSPTTSASPNAGYSTATAWSALLTTGAIQVDGTTVGVPAVYLNTGNGTINYLGGISYSSDNISPGTYYAVVIAWNPGTGGDSTIAAASGNGDLVGWSKVFSYTATSGGTATPATMSALPGTFGVGGTVVGVPEPSTLALAGLGGFGMLMAFRRKKA